MKKRLIIKTLLILTMIAIVGFDISFADSVATTTANENMGLVASIINFIISVASRIWIFFANMAGQMLTNSRVYGTGGNLGIDSYLWICRNMVKNISNFLLGFLFLYQLLVAMFSSEKTNAIIKSIITKILVAGIGIQASWFLVAAILDISTIATITVGSIPSQLVSSNASFSEGMQRNTFFQNIRGGVEASKTTFNKVTMDLFGNKNQSLLKVDFKEKEGILDDESLMDLFMPNGDSLAGPLVFLGMGILETNKISTVDASQPVSTLIKIGLEGFSTIAYSIAMIILCIVAFIRIIYLWMFIVLSPLLVLIFCLENIGNSKIKGIGEISKQLDEKGFSVKGFLGIAFKPVVITIGISLALIFTVLMKKTITTEPIFDVNGSTIESKETSSSTIAGQSKRHTTLDNQTLSVTIRGINKTFAELILSIITVVLIRMIVKISFTSGTGIKSLDNFTKNTFKTIGDFGKNIPIIPIGGETLTANSIRNERGDGFVNRLQNQARTLSGVSDTTKETIDKMLNTTFGGNYNSISESEYIQLEKTIKKGENTDAFLQYTKQLNKKNTEIGLQDKRRTASFVGWLNNTNLIGTQNDLQRIWRGKGYSKEENLQTFLNDTNTIKKYRETFGGTGEVPASYSELIQRRNFGELAKENTN